MKRNAHLLLLHPRIQMRKGPRVPHLLLHLRLQHLLQRKTSPLQNRFPLPLRHQLKKEEKKGKKERKKKKKK